MADTEPLFAKPRLAFRVGIAGHRKRRAQEPWDEAGAIAKALALIGDKIDLFAADHGALYRDEKPSLFFLNALALGADRVGARAAVASKEHPWQLAVVLPFAPPDTYRPDDEKDEGPQAQAEFEELLKLAGARVLVLDGARDDERTTNLAYETAGRTVMRNSDLLVAVWDGEEGKGRGGTAALVEDSLRQGRPVLWIFAGEPRAFPLRNGDKTTLHPGTPVWLVSLDDLNLGLLTPPAWDDVGAAVGKALEGILGLNEPHRPHPARTWKLPLASLFSLLGARQPSEREKLAAFYGEGRSTPSRLAKFFVLFRDWIAPKASYPVPLDNLTRTLEIRIAGPRGKSAGSIPQRGLADGWAERVKAAAGRLIDKFKAKAPTPPPMTTPFSQSGARIDSLALDHSNLYRSTYLSVLLATALALSCAAGALVSHGWLQFGFAAAEFVIIALAATVIFLERRGRWHIRWVEYRLLAELFRVMDHLAIVGRALPPARPWTDTAGHRSVIGWAVWYVNAIVREHGMTPVDCSNADYRRKATEWTSISLTLDQIKYHGDNSFRSQKVASRLEGIGEWLFALTLLALFVKLGFEASELRGFEIHMRHMGTIMLLLGLVGILAPGWSAAFFAVRQQAEFTLLERRSEAMAERLSQLFVYQCEALASADAPLWCERLGETQSRLASIMVEDASDWASLFETKVAEAE